MTRPAAPAPVAQLSASTVHIRADTAGALRASWPESGTSRDVISDAGLWLAGVQEGEVRASLRVLDASNISALDGNRQVGVFRLSADSLEGVHVTGWPVEYGAPQNGAGQPSLIGDEMLWSAYVPRQSEIPDFRPMSLLASPMEDVVVSQTVSAFRRDDLKDAVFIHFRILNRGVSNIDNLHLGFYADVDIQQSGCISLLSNSVGYDSLSAFSYTYPSEAWGDAELDCGVPVIGYSLVHTTSSEAHAAYHVPLGKNTDIFEFSEATLRKPEDVLRRLQGLSSAGESMVDPNTNRVTRIAFTGDPVDETGWLGNRSDARSLLSIGEFTLLPEESIEMTVVVIVKEANRLSESLSEMRQQFRTIEESGVLQVFPEQ